MLLYVLVKFYDDPKWLCGSQLPVVLPNSMVSNRLFILIIIYNVDYNTLNQENLLFTCSTGPAIKMRQGFYTISTIINKKII